MPYEYKKKQSCKQKSGESGNYVTKKKGASSQKCWKSKTAHDNSKQAYHASMGEGDGVIPVIDGDQKIEERALRGLVTKILIESTLDELWVVSESPIHGDGVFATDMIPGGTNLGVAHVLKPNGRYHVTELGHNHNHSYEPNCVNKMINGTRYLFAKDDIPMGTEITVDYTLQPDLEQPLADWV